MDVHRPVKTFLRQNAAAFGHADEVLGTARIKRDYVTAHNGLRTTVWEQELDELPILDGGLVGTITRDGELATIINRLVPNPAEAADRGNANRHVLQKNPRISQELALVIAAKSLDEDLLPSQIQRESSTGGSAKQKKEDPPAVQRFERFRAPVFNGPVEASLAWFPLNRSVLRLAWDIWATSRTHGESFRVLVDAESGQLLFRQSLTFYSTPPYRVFTSDSPTPYSPGHNSCGIIDQPSEVQRPFVWDLDFSFVSSPYGWIWLGANETRGNNVHAYLDWWNENEPREHLKTRGFPNPNSDIFHYPWNGNPSDGSTAHAAVVNLFYWCNWMHDQLWRLGFTPEAGNFEGDDPIMAEAQDSAQLAPPGGKRNNARFSASRDGTPARIEMYLFDGPVPTRDSSVDAEIILHEYAHGLTFRLIAGQLTLGFIPSHTFGLFEGWSDFYALALLSEASDDLGGNYALGGYSNLPIGVRSFPGELLFWHPPVPLLDGRNQKSFNP